MKLWRPTNRVEWWFAFVGALLVLAPAVSFCGFAIAQLFSAEYLSWLGRIAAAIPAVYLILVSGVGPAWKALVAPAVAAAVLVTYVPRSSCGDEDPPGQLANRTETRGCNG